MQIFSVSFVTLLLACLGQCQQTDYCDETLCPPNQVHIGCNNDGSLGRDCAKNAKLIVLSKDLQSNIFYIHNMLRNALAGGHMGHMPRAGRMATMVWDPELAYLAELNVKRCRFEQDECLSTKKFPHPGQNLAYSSFRGHNIAVDSTTLRQIRTWFNGHLNVSADEINSYSQPKDGTGVKQFMQVMQEKATHFGCAVLRQKVNRRTQQFMTCNYAVSNTISQPVYTIAEKGGEYCTTGHHRKYEYLCSLDEIYDLSK